MALLTGKAEPDFSACSCHNLEQPSEVQARKGCFYQRARLLRPGEDPSRLARPGDRSRSVIINVGGIKYKVPWSSLENCPLGRLGRLKTCSSHDELLDVCDDYDVGGNEFFFDRSPSAFGSIVTFLGAGKLRLLREMCALSFREELAYWGVPEERLERCCKRRLRQREEEAAEAGLLDGEAAPGEAAQRGHRDRGRRGPCMRRLRDMVENPRSGVPGKIFACISISFVAITAVSLCISTMPDVRDEEERGECSRRCRDIFVLETVCVGWFSLEFLLRSIQAEDKCAFLRTPLNLIDVLAILPFYVSLLVGAASAAGGGGRAAGNKYLERAGLVLRFLRALRILYVMRLARHSLGLQTLGLTVRRCTREFGLLLLFLCVAMALFSPLVYLAESELGAKQEFTSVPTSYWWAVISMTTVGYGDMVPRSIPGQVVALSSILSGILLMAFPVTSIFHTFSRSYSELKEQQQRAAIRQMRQLEEGARLRGATAAQGTGVPLPPAAAAAQEGQPVADQETQGSC